LPEGARAIEARRGDATVRAWVFEPSGSARGTVLLLHGIRSKKQHFVARARHHAARGLRAVAVDSRGHGESSGRFLTYGVEEARDLVQLIDVLEQRALLAPPLSIVGNSYGAATALLHAALDRRVARVAAVAPFASLREVVPAYLSWRLGPLARLIPDALVDELVDGAARQASFDADDACPRCVASRIKARVLLVHSRDDERIPFHHSLEIRDAMRAPAQLLLVDGVSHAATGSSAEVMAQIDTFIR
jgi:pimeloyl-ACP methyl ester carboxylesterase